MSYQLRQSQTLGDNLRRICRKQIEGAIAIAKGEKESRANGDAKSRFKLLGE
jgi:hypothetical protein